MKKLISFSDDGHGWLRVSKKDNVLLSIIDDISFCSYQSECFYYLEEDRDAVLYLTALKEKNIPFTIKNRRTNGQSKIRNLRRF